MADAAVRQEINRNFALGTQALGDPNAPPFVAPPGAPGAALAHLEKEKAAAAAALKDLPKAAAAAGRRHTRRHRKSRRRHRKTNSVRRKTRGRR